MIIGEASIRRPPHNIEAEQGVLGAILLDNRHMEKTEPLAEHHFFDPIHAQIFSAITTTVGGGRLASPVTMQGMFAGYEPIDQNTTVPQYLGRLAAMAAVPSSLRGYADIIIEYATRRSLIVIAEDVTAAAYDVGGELSADDQIKHAESQLCKLAESGHLTSELEFASAISMAVQQISDAHQRKGRLAGLSTGLTDLDAKLGGMQSTDLIVLAGRPAMGKTALATNLAYSVATSSNPDAGEFGGGHVHFFSQEMSAAQLALRILAERTGVSGDMMRRGQVETSTLETVIRSAQRIGSAPITIDETGGISLAQLAARARRVKRRSGTCLIVIDYLQLMSGNVTRKFDNRVNEITAITTGLKALAKELRVPILALSQLSRKVEERADKRPQLADLRESGSIEQDADVVLFVYRDDYYLSREEPADDQLDEKLKWKDRLDNASGKAEVIVAKHRHGPTGIVPLAFDASLTRFGNLMREGRYDAR